MTTHREKRIALVTRARQLRERATSSEALLWEALRRAVPEAHFRRQHPLYGFIVDFYSVPHRLMIEVDGGVHEGLREADAERQRILESHGLRVIRVAAGDVEGDLPAVLARVQGQLTEERGRGIG